MLRKLPFTFSCYLIKHGDDYMRWDTSLTPLRPTEITK